MCTPAIGLVVGAASGIMSAVGSYQQGQSQSNMYTQQAMNGESQAQLLKRTADQNTELLKRNAEQNITSNTIEASQASKDLARKVGAVEGADKAVGAFNKIGGGSVTEYDIGSSNFDKAKLDEIALRYNADSRAYEINENTKNNIWSINNDTANAAWGLRTQGKGYSMAAKNARKAGSINAASSLLSSATSLTDSYNKWKY